MNTLIATQSIEIDASLARVWETLIEPDLTEKYMFGCRVKASWKIGELVEWRGTYQGETRLFVTGRLVTFEPESKLVYTTFDPQGKYADLPENYTTQTCVLTATAKGTRLEMSQGDFAKLPDGKERYASHLNDDGAFLKQLKAVAEQHTAP